ncbi:hypothetical protein B0H66DRAFT_196226 [Apodospora peruviana]|uniref:Uncharacterized protein n=1 Tax=Apodospora peruviana TaxID=516989 RepID=A0AAE0IBV4_9PEZI|nr:hypothetical protein B0H66DRAFT_196226 [Apodospora peruviana]
MNANSRAPAPPPLKMPTRVMTSPINPTPKSADSARYSSDDYYTDMISSPPASRSRKSSGSSTGSNKKPKSPNVNANSYCGRHSDQYLFGGHSIGELWRNITKKE